MRCIAKLFFILLPQGTWINISMILFMENVSADTINSLIYAKM